MQHLYAIKVQWQHEGQNVAGCILVQASNADDALQRAGELLPTRIPEGKNVVLSSKVEKVSDNCFHRLREGTGATEDQQCRWCELLRTVVCTEQRAQHY